MYTNIGSWKMCDSYRYIDKVIVSCLKILSLDWHLGVTFLTYVCILFVRSKSYAP
jgi:hypothetical protein